MFERVLGFFKDLPFPRDEASAGRDDPRVAAAALLHHVMDADGVRQDVEWDRIKAILETSYDVHGAKLDALAKAGEAADQEAIDLYAFTTVLNRHLDEAGKVAFVRMLWEVVYADGVLHELEDNTIWRIAELIGVDRRDRVLARRDVAALAPRAEGEAADE